MFGYIAIDCTSLDRIAIIVGVPIEAHEQQMTEQPPVQPYTLDKLLQIVESNERLKRGVSVITFAPRRVIKKSVSPIPHVVSPIVKEFCDVPKDSIDKLPSKHERHTIESDSEEVFYYVDEEVDDDLANDHDEELGVDI